VDGNCGVSTISGKPIGGGKVEVVAQLYSFQGAITGGTVSIVRNGGSKSYEPTNASGNRVSLVYTIQAKAGETLNILLNGFAITGGEACTVKQPVIEVPVS
jgi:hypothetical protein